jgi:hypothetical protein
MFFEFVNISLRSFIYFGSEKFFTRVFFVNLLKRNCDCLENFHRNFTYLLDEYMLKR